MDGPNDISKCVHRRFGRKSNLTYPLKTFIETNKQTGRQTDRQTDRQRQKDRERGREGDRQQTDRKTNRYTETETERQGQRTSVPWTVQTISLEMSTAVWRESDLMCPLKTFNGTNRQK